jgi:hypothetical protein
MAQVRLETTPLHASLYIGSGLITPVFQQNPGVLFATMSAGQVSIGGDTSVTVTVKLQLALLLAASRAVYVTVVTPRLKVTAVMRFIPVGGEFPLVAPPKVQVSAVTAQLSA